MDFPQEIEISPGQVKTKPEGREIARAFAAFSGIEAVEDEEVDTLKHALLEEAGKLLTSLRENRLIRREEEEGALEVWENLVALEEPQLKAFRASQTQVYRDMVDDLNQLDPDASNAEAQELITQAKALIEQQERDVAGGLIFSERLNNADQERAERARAAGMPERWITVNWTRRDELIQDPRRLRAAAFEETAHMISHLPEYDRVIPYRKWVDEMMARVVAFELPWGHRETDPGYETTRREMRADDYLTLFHAISNFAGSRRVLLNMFFGREPQDSESVRKVAEAIEQIGMIGEMVDAGISLKDIDKI
jgi:hypothetical protein